MGRILVAVTFVVAAMLSSCATPSSHSAPRSEKAGGIAEDTRPERFRIVPDDYHVPYAGTAEDGRRFFLSEELFTAGTGHAAAASYVGLFLWNADGTFDEVRVDKVRRPEGVPPGQAAPAGAKKLVDRRFAELGDYELEPIEVEPFTEKVDGVTFGWKVSRFDGTYSITIEPGDFIAYYAPWDGLDYDT